MLSACLKLFLARTEYSVYRISRFSPLVSQIWPPSLQAVRWSTELLRIYFGAWNVICHVERHFLIALLYWTKLLPTVMPLKDNLPKGCLERS